MYVFAVLKAERVSNESLSTGYIFPDESDNLSAYTGGSAQVMVPGGLLQNLCKYTVVLLLSSFYCNIYVHIMSVI